jgi:hypothetical protein
MAPHNHRYLAQLIVVAYADVVESQHVADFMRNRQVRHPTYVTVIVSRRNLPTAHIQRIEMTLVRLKVARVEVTWPLALLNGCDFLVEIDDLDCAMSADRAADEINE